MDIFPCSLFICVTSLRGTKNQQILPKVAIGNMADSGENSSFWTDLCVKINDFFSSHRHVGTVHPPSLVLTGNFDLLSPVQLFFYSFVA